MTQKNQRILGLVFWGIVFAGGLTWMIGSKTAENTNSIEGVQTTENTTESPASLILSSLWTTQETFEITDPTGVVRVGDVVFAPNPQSKPTDRKDSESPPEKPTWHEVGYVTSVRKPVEQNDNKGAVIDKANRLTVTMFEPDAWSKTATFTVHRNSGRLEDVVETLVPPEKREQLQLKLSLAFEAHANAIARELVPLVVKSTQATVPLIESAVTESIANHEAEIDALVGRYREEIVRERIVPLVREEVLPIVRKHGQEPAESIGREVWNRASLWRFGWRAIYDKSPLPERELVVEEWRRFVDDEVVPIVEDHLDEIAFAVENIVKDLAANDTLREELSEVFGTIANDPEARELLRTILRESVVDNTRIRHAWSQVWSSPEAKAGLRRAGERIEPVLREIGDELMGTRRGGIEPGFARLLRNQILAKDRTWITITPGGGDMTGDVPIRLTESRRFMPYPVVYVVQNHNL